MSQDNLILVECPRDAMQGIQTFIDTELKVKYINYLLDCEFDVLDVGSFVSPKAIPQMSDTAEVLRKIDLSKSQTKLLTIIANEKGADQAVTFDEVSILGFPFSVSNTFQIRNTNKSIEESFGTLEYISNLCQSNNKSLVVYLSMGFGNPYGDEWHSEILQDYISNLSQKFKIDTFALSDTIGAAHPELVFDVFSNLKNANLSSEISAHLHVQPENAIAILDAAYKGGCRRFDSAMKGFGGCPMATNKLTGNMPTEKILEWMESSDIHSKINKPAFELAYNFSSTIFNHD
jgi:hydroxymethylglutaryl-CoA lyase